MAAIAANEGLEGSSSLVQSVLETAIGIISALRSTSSDEGSMRIMFLSLSSSLSLLQYTAEEIEMVIEPWAKKQTFIRALHEDKLPKIAILVHDILSLCLSLNHIQLATRAIGCFYSWLKLDPSGSGGLYLSPSEMKKISPSLLLMLIRSLILRGDAGSLASEVVSNLCGPGKTAPGDEEVLMEVLTDICSCYYQAIVTPPSFSSSPEVDTWCSLARNVSCIITAISEREIILVSSDSQGNGGQVQLTLAQMMLACISHSGSLRINVKGEEAGKGRRVAEAVLDYFVIINTIPTAERLPQMCKPLFTQAFEPILANTQYPRSFQSSWDDCVDDDEDDFYRFRSQQLSEALESCYGMMKVDLFSSLLSSCNKCMANPYGLSWQRFESLLFCLQTIGSRVKERVLGREGKGPTAIPGGEAAAQVIAEEYQTLKTLLLTIFSHLCGSESRASSGYLSNPMVAATACKLIGEYSVVFEALDEAPTEGALNLTLRCLAIPSSSPSAAAAGSSLWQKAAATAFRSLCIKCASKLSKDPHVLLSLIDAATSIVAPPLSSSQLTLSIGQDERTEVFEGLSRAISIGFENLGPDRVGDAGIRLTSPLLIRAEACAQSLGSPQALSILASDLSLLSSVVRFLDSSLGQEGLNQHPVMKVLQGAWPVLGGISQSRDCQTSPMVIQSLCEVFSRSLLSAKKASRPLLPTLTSSLLAIYKVSQLPCICEVLGTVTEVFGELKSGDDVGLQKNTFYQICAQSSVLSFIQSTVQDPLTSTSNRQNVAEHSDLIRAVFSLADRFLIFARSTLLSSSGLPLLLSCAPLALSLRDKDAMSSILAFLSHLMALIGDKENHGMSLDEDSALLTHLLAILSSQGPRLIQSLLLAILLGTCPTSLIRSLGSCLRLLVDQPASLGLDPSRVAALVTQAVSLAAVSSPSVVNVGQSTNEQGETSTDQGWERFVHLVALRQPRLPKGRFEAMLMDVAGVMERGIAGSLGNALVAYEL